MPPEGTIRHGVTRRHAMFRILVLLLAISCSSFAAAADKPAKETPGIAELLRGTPSAAVQLLHGEAAAGSARAASYMAVALEYGWGTNIDHQGARAYARQASEAGFAAATLLSYYEFDEPLSDAQLREAKSAATKKARQGDPLSLYYVGLAAAGDANTADVVLGVVAAAAVLALAGDDDYEDEDSEETSDESGGVDASYLSDKSKKYFQHAYAAGFAPAGLVLGQLHEAGRGFPQELTRAFDYYLAAAQRDVALGDNSVGRALEAGYASDPALVRQGPIPWYERAAGRGDADAMTRLAMLHYRGTGVPRDRAKAQDLLMQAASLGDRGAVENLRAIEAEISKEQALERQRLAHQQARERQRLAREQAVADRKQPAPDSQWSRCIGYREGPRAFAYQKLNEARATVLAAGRCRDSWIDDYQRMKRNFDSVDGYWPAADANWCAFADGIPLEIWKEQLPMCR